MNILGVADGLHAGAALTVNGELVAVSHQERLDRVPASQAFPWRAVDDVLAMAGLAPSDIDLIGVAGRFSPPFMLRRHPGLREMVSDPFSPIHDARVWFHALLRQTGLGAVEADRAGDWLEARFAERGFAPQRVILVAVHRALAEAAYRLQDDDTDVLVLTAHPKGDGVALAVHAGNSAQLDRYWTQKGFASLHVHLERCTAAVGLRPGVDEQLLWGIAASGEPTEDLGVLLDEHLGADGLRLSKQNYLVPASRKDRVYAALAEAPIAEAAASVQANLRRTVVELLRRHISQWGIATVALGGRVFDNPRLVAAVAEMDEVERVLAGPEPGWGSLAIGAATMLAGRPPRPVGHVGTAAPDVSEAALAAAVERLAEGQAVAHVSGRAGFGPEGLGTRAVLVRADDQAALERARTALGRAEHEAPLGLVTVDTAKKLRHYAKFDLALDYGAVAPVVSQELAGALEAVIANDGRARLATVTDGPVAALLAGLEAKGIAGLAALPLAPGSEPTVATVDEGLQIARGAGLHALMAP